MKGFRVWVIAALFVISSAAWAAPQAEQLIEPNNAKLRYTGRIDFTDKAAPLMSWPGTSIKGAFKGPLLKVVLNDELGKNYFNVIIDGEIEHPFVIKAEKGQVEYTLSRALSEGLHTFELYKRTEGEEGYTLFKGLKIHGGLFDLPPRQSRKIEIYGDSITSGMGNEAADNAVDNLLSEKNNYWAYGAITARDLNAELHTISQSGIGIMVSWFPFVMPQFYDQLSAVGDNDTRWDFTQWTPDVVVINLFQNDSWLVDRDKKLDPLPNDQQRVQAYVDFVQAIRAKYPKVQIICALGSMDATANEKWPDYIREAVRIMQNDFHDKKIDAIFFPYNGYGKHPRIAQHKANAKILADFIRQKMKWR